MKKLFTMMAAGVLMASCSKTETKEIKINNSKSDSTATKPFVVDSLRVQDSLAINKNLTASFNKKVLLFPSIDNKTILDSIYKQDNISLAKYDATTLKAALETEMKKSFDDTKKSIKEFSPQSKQTWDAVSDVRVVSNQHDVMTLKYFGSGYTGGAHGYYYEKYKVFDLKNNKVMSQNDIFKNPSDANWNKILSAHFDNKDQKEMLLVDKIEPNNNFFFDQDKITFVYNQYEITAYAAGVVKITLSFKDIKDQLKPEFVKQFNIK